MRVLIGELPEMQRLRGDVWYNVEPILLGGFLEEKCLSLILNYTAETHKFWNAVAGKTSSCRSNYFLWSQYILACAQRKGIDPPPK